VHLRTVARQELAKYRKKAGHETAGHQKTDTKAGAE
jgi:hypothetical protein